MSTDPIVLTPPLTEKVARALTSGQEVLFNGTLYTARDAAHQRLCGALQKGESLPFPIDGAVIYYVGPTPGRSDQVLGAAGPTTSYRMDAYAPQLIERGLRGMIGKGKRNDAVVSAMQEHGATYFAATGGAGALLAKCIVASEIIAYEDLGTEAIRKLTVENFPAIVAQDAAGGCLYA